MAKKQDDKPVDDEDEDKDEESGSESEGEEAGETSESESDSEGQDLELKEAAPLARVASEGEEAEGDEADGEPDVAAGQLGIDRYVLAGFFASGILAAYVVGRTLQAVWVSFSNRDWFSQAVPRLAGLSDDEKTTYSFVVAGIVALILVIRIYRRPDVRTWADDVAGELAKVKWPSKKEVYSSTFIVIVASAAATLYLALLDRLWAFVTNIVYGDGS